MENNVLKTVLNTFNNNVETYLAKPRKSGKRQAMKKLNKS